LPNINLALKDSIQGHSTLVITNSSTDQSKYERRYLEL